MFINMICDEYMFACVVYEYFRQHSKYNKQKLYNNYTRMYIIYMYLCA